MQLIIVITHRRFN